MVEANKPQLGPAGKKFGFSTGKTLRKCGNEKNA